MERELSVSVRYYEGKRTAAVVCIVIELLTGLFEAQVRNGRWGYKTTKSEELAFQIMPVCQDDINVVLCLTVDLLCKGLAGCCTCGHLFCICMPNETIRCEDWICPLVLCYSL